MEQGLQQLKTLLEGKVSEIDKRIERRSGACFHDESKKIDSLHSDAYVYENIIKMIDEITA